MKDCGEIIRRVDAIDETIRRRLGAANLSFEQGIEGPFDIARGERPAIMKSYPAMQMEDVRQSIGNLPAFGEPRLDVQMVVTREQGIEKKLAYALGLRIDSDARIEICRTALDNHDQRVRAGGLCAG